MKISKETLNFNKEILFGEIGSLIGIQIVSFISMNFFFYPKLIPYLTVLGGMIGGSFSWLWARVYYKSKEGDYPRKKFFKDIEYFTPASVLFSVLFYYPVLFFASKHFLIHHQVEFSTITAQILAFGIFLAGINLYRYILLKVFKKEL
jgi:hypothetical protein